MTRRAAVLASVLAAGCGSRQSEFRFPDIAGAWKLSIPPAPAETPKGGRRAWQATYTGPIQVKATVAEMLSAPNAFDAVQRWRYEPGKGVFYRQQYFGVVESPGATAKEIDAFLHAFEEASAK